MRHAFACIVDGLAARRGVLQDAVPRKNILRIFFSAVSAVSAASGFFTGSKGLIA